MGVCLYVIQTEANSNDACSKPHPLREIQQSLNPKTGRLEVVFVDLQKVYPNRDDPMSLEFSFEELRAEHRGWMKMNWAAIRQEESDKAKRAAEAAVAEQVRLEAVALASKVVEELPKPQVEPLKPMIEANLVLNDENAPPRPTASRTKSVPLKGSIEDELVINDENSPPSQAEVEKARAVKKARKEERANRTRKIKVMDVKEIRGETQTSKSPCDTSQHTGSLTSVQSKQTSILRLDAKYDARRAARRLQ